ncbi:type II toxin-antitoxin system prevent-host-death family antitoxin [bacterium]|jgi:prevent-host-death family protein|nr:type II toxin-antitoxin system prevent-host-death family antitoxin [bacterium]
MITDQCVSVTDLKKDMNAIIKDLKREKIIFVNNTPVAVLMDVRKYEKILSEKDILSITVEPKFPKKLAKRK